MSFIYTSIGCFHSLQPGKDPFTPPSIPALTPEGFVKWQTVQLLLQPDEHVPFLQEAVKRFPIINPDDGEPFPTILPRDAFPRKASDAMLEWHENALQRLRPIENVQGTPRGANASEEVESLPDSSTDSHSIVDAGDYFDSSHRPRSSSSTRPSSSSSARRSSPAFTRPNVLPTLPTGHRPHHLKAAERPSYGEFRRRSHSGEPSFREDPWSRDGPTPTELPKLRTPQTARPRTSSGTPSSEANEDQNFPSSEAPQSPLPPEPRIHSRKPSRDSYGRRHSAHSPYDTQDYVPPIDYGRKNTLSPPFYAHQRPQSQPGLFRNIPAPPKNTNIRWRDMEYVADPSSYPPKDPSSSRLSVRYVDSNRISRGERTRRRSIEPTDGVSGRKYVSDTSGWR